MARPPFNIDLPGIMRRTQKSASPVTFTPSNAQHSEEQCSGVSRHKPQGWIAPTAYSLFSRKYHLAVGRIRYTHPSTDWIEYNGVVGGVGGPFNSLNHFNEIANESQVADLSLRNAALIDARRKLKQCDVNLGVAFAERNATARLLGDTATNIGRAFKSLKSGNVRDAMNHLGISSRSREPRGSNVPSKWLEMQYGWKPMLSDVYGACKALEKGPMVDWRVTAKSFKHSEALWVKTWINSEAGLGKAEAKRSNFTRLDALPGNGLLGSLASLGVTNPLLIGWELVPYSFVVDWALPVGNWLDSLDALLGYREAYYSSTQLERCEWKEEGRPYSNPGFGVVESSYEGGKVVVQLNRVASSGVPLPTFPRIKDPRSLGHMANGLALLASAFGRNR